ncbi:hypothetical protein AT6N2_C3095 [Agrobacterium tumefaciens]|nr:hypothetical protein AT6N2_C3095 [Agrobacterium tumefaciens]
MQLHLAGGFLCLDEREAAQIGDGVADGNAFQRRLPLGGGHHIVALDLRGGRLDHVHPLANEIAGRQRLEIGIECCLDAAAAAVTHDDDVLYLQNLNSIFDGGGGCVILPVGLEGWHHVGNVADDEQLSRSAVENGFRCRTGVTTGDEQRLRFLSGFRQNAVSFALIGIAAAHEVLIAVEKVFRKIFHLSQYRCGWTEIKRGTRCVEDQSVGAFSLF